MDFFETEKELDELRKVARETLSLLPSKYTLMANLDMEYKRAKAILTAKLELEGKAKTVIPTLVDGDENVSKLKRDYIIAESDYKATQDRHNLAKFEAKMVDNQIDREWHSGGY